MSGVLAYAFWHVPLPDTARDIYEQAMAAFHRALAADPPDGFRGGFTLALQAPPWFDPEPEVYLDVYTVDDFTGLGSLNEAAVSGPRHVPHDAVAALAASGTAGVLRLVDGAPVPPAHAAFVTKPPGLGHGAFIAALADAAPDGSSVWMRQMTLGPGPEFWVLSPARAAELPGDVHHAAVRIAAEA